MIELTLGWPDRALSPNSRKHWRAKAKYQQAAHTEGFAVMLDWMYKHSAPLRGVPPGHPVPVTMLFCPPDRRPRDLGLGRVDGDPGSGRGQRLDHREHARELLGGRHRGGLGVGRLTADVEDVRPLVEQLPPVSDRRLGGEERPTVGE